MTSKQMLILALGLGLVLANGIASREIQFLWGMIGYSGRVGTPANKPASFTTGNIGTGVQSV